MGILTINTDFEKLWGEPEPTIHFNLLNYQIFTFNNREQSCDFSVIDNNGNDVTDLCEIMFNNDYIHLNEDGNKFVVDSDTSIGTYSTTAVAIYRYKSATVTATTEINTIVEELPRISFVGRYNIETDEGTEGTVPFQIIDNKQQDVTKDCTIKFSNDYVHLNEDRDEFVVDDDVEAGEYTTIVTAIYSYKGVTATTQTTIYVTVNSVATLNYLSLTALEPGNITITIPSYVTSVHASSISYSTNGRLWLDTSIDNTDQTITIPVSTNNIVYLKGIANQWGMKYNFSKSYNANITSSGNIKVSGNIMSLIYGDLFENQTEFPQNSSHNFEKLFAENDHLVDVSTLTLPATTLTDSCYLSMFNNCSTFADAPALPATTLNVDCYNGMFSGCTALTTAPELPATRMRQNCYAYMFQNCRSLTSAPTLSATSLQQGCYEGMFKGCTSLTAAPALPATTMLVYCYKYMFQGCTSLTAAPALPATTVKTSSYEGMFKGCTSLVTPPALPATTLLNSCYKSMFSGCTSLTSAPTLSATSMIASCYDSMFKGCTSLTTAPDLPATYLNDLCYQYMFQDCTSLVTPPPALPATTLKKNCYTGMFSGCTSITTSPILPATAVVNSCYTLMFSGCSSLSTITCYLLDGYNTTNLNLWVKDVAANGTFLYNPDYQGEIPVGTNTNGAPAGWTQTPISN